MCKHLFYIIKPFIPRHTQLFIRRQIILNKVKKYQHIWPILTGSEKKPDVWKSWPSGKKFSLVLTHDVEHQKGYDRVIKLMEIEKEMGFVSAFYFVPERDYKVDPKLLKLIGQNGFEYGVHGLNHDGKLFSSESEFLIRAEKINKYIKDWGALGFRSPAMHHNLDWIGKLDIEYDLSTFDTDPFEPQPDGVGTIFPFWVPNKRHKNGGYWELPYTLPQDFTVFVLMREQTIKIWQDKTDWIVQNGGMVLVNVHPDYISFHDSSAAEEFPVKLYKEFLVYLMSEYSGNYWNALPKEVAAYLGSEK